MVTPKIGRGSISLPNEYGLEALCRLDKNPAKPLQTDGGGLRWSRCGVGSAGCVLVCVLWSMPYEALEEDESGRSVGGGGQIATMKQLPLTSCAPVLLVFLQMNGFYVPCVMMPFRLFTCPPFPRLFSVVVGGDGGGGGRGSVGAVYALCLVTTCFCARPCCRVRLL